LLQLTVTEEDYWLSGELKVTNLKKHTLRAHLKKEH